MTDIITNPDVARRCLTGDTMRDVAQEGIRAAVEQDRKLSEANLEIGRLRAELEETSRQLALAEIQLGRRR